MAPTLARDGRIVETPGFDHASGLLVNIELDIFPSVPLTPTKDDAARALERLLHPMRAFPFVDEPDEELAGITLPELLAKTRALEAQIEELMRDEGIPLMRLLEPAIDVEPVPAGPDDAPKPQV